MNDLVLLRAGILGLPIFGAALLTFLAVRDPKGNVNRALSRHIERLRKDFADLFVFIDPRPILFGQGVLLYVFATLAILGREPVALMPIPFVLVLPSMTLAILRSRRKAKLENQVDGFVLALSSALHSTPNVGDAFRSMLDVVSDPLRSEIDLTLKHIRLGATFEQSLLHMGRRIGSRAFDTALSSILIGQRLGGNVPTTLTVTGEALRELSRLHRASRARLASSRFQLRIIACAPFVISVAAEQVQPGYFAPFRSHAWGPIAIAVAVLCWFAALILGRRFLNVQV